MRLARVGWGFRAVALALVVVGLVAAVATLRTARHTADLEADTVARGAAARALAVTGSTLRDALNRAAARTDASGRQILFELAEEYGIPSATAVRARDTGRPLLDEAGIVVTAVYRSTTPPASVAERREAISALYLIPLRLRSTFAQLRPEGGGVVLRGPQQVVAAVPATRPADAASYAVEVPPVLAPDWTLTVWVPPQRISLLAWTTAVALALAGLGGAVLLLRRAERAAATQEELRRLRLQSETLTGLAAVAQRSLDLADVLPAVATQLTTSLDLRGLSLTAPTLEGERSFFSSGPPIDVEPSRPLRSVDLSTGVAGGELVSIPLSRGGRTIARMHFVPGRDLDREELGMLSAVAEILSSALANAEAFAQQRDLLQRLRSVDELKTVFLATASHELRTPVGVISGFASLLSTRVDRLTPDQIRTYADRVESNARQLAGLVENLLDFSRLERGMGIDTAEHSELDLGETVSRILAQQPDLAVDHRLVRQVDADLRVAGTEHAVERVLTNLVGNAVKYSPAGSTVRIQVRAGDGRGQVIVDDEGPGVPTADREQVFSRFFRGGGDAVVRTRGAGLGLAIVREFAASMGGEVSVDAAPSGGARFVVSYPLISAEQSSEGETHVAS